MLSPQFKTYTGGPPKGGHLRRKCLPVKLRTWYESRPVQFSHEQLRFKLDDDQSQWIESVRDNPRTSVRTGHGVGKTAFMACTTCWWNYCHDPSIVLATGPTRTQLYDNLWLELARIINGSRIAADLVWTATGLYVRNRKQEQVAQARTSNNPQALAGRHGKNILLLVEEASSIPDNVFLPAASVMTEPGARMLLIGNPILLQGVFYRSFHQDKDDFARFHKSAENHPRVSQQFYVDWIAKRYGGKKSDVFRCRVQGEFPIGEPGTMIPLSRVMSAQRREVEPNGPWVIAVDVAGMGDDRCVLLPGRGLKIYHDPAIVEIETYARVEGSGELCGYVMNMVRRLRKLDPALPPVVVVIDGGGMGWGPAGDLRAMSHEEPNLFAVVERQFGGAGDGEHDNEGTWMWSRLRDLMDIMQLPEGTGHNDLPDQLADEIASRKYELRPNGKIRMEDKAKHKEEHDGLSPDLADSAVMFASVYGWEAPYMSVIPSTLGKQREVR